MRPEILIELEKIKSGLVRSAEDLCKRTIPRGISRNERLVTRGMLQNLLNAANSTNSVPELVNFVRYQIGRSPEGDRWQHGSFGEELTKAIQEAASLPGTDGEVAIEAVRHLCGYVLRHATYLSSVSQGSRPEQGRELLARQA